MMLDGTDLNDAYSLIRHEAVGSPQEPPKIHQPQPLPSPPVVTPVMPTQSPKTQPQQQQHTTLQQLQQMQQQQRLVVPTPVAMIPPVRPRWTAAPAPQQPPSYLESLVQQRRDMLKYIVLSFVILLALACHTAIKFAFKEYILANDLSFKQELAVRLGYPVTALIVLWNLRALSK